LSFYLCALPLFINRVMIRIFIFLLINVLLFSCKDDSGKSTKAEDIESQKIEALKKETNAKNKSTAKDGHNDHDHAEKPEMIENNSRVRVPVEKIKKQSPPSYTTPEDNPSKTKGEMQQEFQKGMQSARFTLPEPCGLLSDGFIANVIGVEKDAITLKDGSNPATPYARSCFFRWDHRGTPNSGVLIQVQSNPVPNEFPDWAPYYLQAKRNQGEKSPDGSLVFKYKDFDKMGVDGAYSYDLHRYLWRDAKNYVYMVAFNLPATESEEVEWARKLGAELMKNANL